MFTKKADNPVLTINLQLFNNTPAAASAVGGEPAGAPAAGGEPAATAPVAPAAAEPGEPITGDPRPSSVQELWEKHAAAGQEQNPLAGQPVVQSAGEPAAQPASPAPSPEVTPEWVQSLPDKFKNPDGSVNYEALATSYMNLEPELTRKSTELSQLRQRMQGEPQQQPQQPGQPPAQAPQGQPQYTPEQLTQLGEQFIDGLLDPARTMETLTGIINMAVNQAHQSIMPKIAPLLEKDEHNQYVDEWTQQLTALAQTNPDVMQLTPVMAEILNEPITGPDGQPVTVQAPNGQIVPVTTGDYLGMMPNGVQVAYNLAKSRQAQNLKSPEELLNDREFWTKAAGHPEIKKMVLTANVNAVYKGNAQVPTVIGSTPAGTPPATPPTKPTNAQEAGRSFLERLKTGFGM